MAHAALRLGRYSAPGNIYLVTTTTIARRPLFRDFYCGRILAKSLRAMQDAGIVDSIAWIIMPDHLHWLFLLREASLDTIMQSVNGRRARQVNAYLQSTGAIWQRAYHEHALRREEAVSDVIDYMLENPIRAGFVANIADYSLWDTRAIFAASNRG